MKDYYNILEVDKNASPDEIKKAYRKMSKKYHPDINKDSDSESRFKEINEAYDVLSNQDKRSNYDRFGDPNGGGFSGGFGGFDINDIFGDFFGGGKSQRQKKGRDLRVKVSLDINDIINGVKKKIRYNRQTLCKPCNGEGGTDPKTCTSCDGSGQRMTIQNSILGQIRSMSECVDCSGRGRVITNKCDSCKGNGTVLKEEIIDVEIPAGVSNGMQLTMSGYGNEINNGISGDLNILIDEVRDINFKREGGNIIIEKDISVIDAIIGSNINVKTPRGEMGINIEPGTETGKILRIKGKGIPDINYGLGDIVVVFKVRIPKNISIDEKSKLSELKNSVNFKI